MAGSIRLGSAPINWGIGPVTPEGPSSDAILDAIAEAGYTGCELGTYGLFGKSAEEVLPRFASRELALITTWHEVAMARPFEGEPAAHFRRLLEILAAGGATVILVSDRITAERLAVVARVERHPETWWTDAEWDQVRRTLRTVSEIAAEYGIVAAIHPHIGGHVESGRELRRLLDLTADDPLKFCLDTGHIQIGGGNPIAFLRDDGHRLVHVHAKDVDRDQLGQLQRGETEFFAAVGAGLFADLGAGMVDWDGFAAGLNARGYDGWVVAEQDRLLDPENQEYFAANARNYTFLDGLLNTD